jgi:hypothetical protein
MKNPSVGLGSPVLPSGLDFDRNPLVLPLQAGETRHTLGA